LTSAGSALRLRWLFLPTALLPLLLLLPCAVAVPRSHTPKTAATIPSITVKGNIGDAVMVLNGPWKFHPGDDPAFAAPEFDDSSWGNQNLTLPPGSYDPVTGSSGFVPGWTSHGFPKLIGFAWYRLRVQAQFEGADADSKRLAIAMPINFEDAYQVYVDGQLLGQFGDFSSNHVVFYNAQPRSFLLPSDASKHPLVIAIRFWMDPSTPMTSEDAGGLHGPPILGESSATDSVLQLEWDAVNRTQLGSLVTALAMALSALLGFIFYSLDRDEAAYFWLGAASLANLVATLSVLLGYYFTIMPKVVEILLQDVIVAPLTLGMWALFWAYWFGLAGIKRIVRSTWALIILTIAVMAAVRPPIYGTLVPLTASSWLVPLALFFRMLLGALLLWVAFMGLRKQGAGGWMALFPILLTVVGAYQEDLGVVHVRTILRLGSLTFGLGIVSNLLMLAIISILMMQRFMHSQRESVKLRIEIEQARLVQQLLIPHATPSFPGFTVESVYRPVQHVGGDFFQFLKAPNGGVLAIIGDVSGKGTPAAMTVALIVGTVRTLAHFLQQPAEILAALNNRMVGRSQGGFTTCLVLRADPDGTVTVANAGHIAPYVQGQEVGIDNGLPLGLSPETTYPETTFKIVNGAQITMVTDGVVEARNLNGELFGFDRTAGIALESADTIVRTAQRFGQDDDITVLTVTKLLGTRRI
jgi:hypothetical protein